MIGSLHPDYAARVSEWSRARDVLAGEDAVKAAGVKYLPRLDSQSDEEYSAYCARASFFGATSRTLEEYVDLVFRRAPVLSVGGLEALPGFAADCDLWGMAFARYARQVLSEVLSVGRGGSLVSWDPVGGRPWVSLWRTENIINWEVERVGERIVLVEVVLRSGNELFVPHLVDGACWREEWRLVDDTWTVVERAAIERDGKPIPFVPFVFHGAKHSKPQPDRLPLADIIAANLDHYRLDADYKHGLHFAALPTAWVTGFDKASPLRIGSSTAWVSEIPGASAGFLEFTGAGLAYIERAMERVERRMALLGARMLETPTGDGQATVSQHGELCGLASVVASLNQSLSRVLQLANWWIVGGDAQHAVSGVSFAMNTDLSARPISAEHLAAVLAAWKAGGISRETMLEALKRGEVLPDGRTVQQERALLHRTSSGG